MKPLITIVFLFCSSLLSAQSPADQLRQYMEEVRGTTYKPMPETLLSEEAHQGEIVTLLGEYAQDTLPEVRQKAYDMLAIVGRKSESPDIRMKTVNLLMDGIADKDSGISGKVSVSLADFRREDFNQEAKDQLVLYLNPAVAHLDQVIKLAGYIGIGRTRLQQLATLQTLSAYERFSVQLAMARLGDSAAVAALTGKLATVSVNDDFVYDLVPELVYTRRREVYDFLVSIIYDDDKNCLSANPNSESRILCGYRVMEYIASAIDGYPLEVDEFGDLEVSSYPMALATVREWFTQNPDFQILDDTF